MTITVVSSYPTSADTVPVIDGGATLEFAQHADLHRAELNRVRATQLFLGLESDYSATGTWARGSKTITRLVSDLATGKLDSTGASATGLTVTNGVLNNATITDGTLNKLTVNNGTGLLTGTMSSTLFDLVSSRDLRQQAPAIQLWVNSGMRQYMSTNEVYFSTSAAPTTKLLSVDNSGNVAAAGATFTGQVVVGADASTANQVIRKSQYDTGLATTLSSAQTFATSAVTTATGRVADVSGTPIRIRAGSTIFGNGSPTLDGSGRGTISFGTTFSTYLGMVLSWGDNVGIPVNSFGGAPAPYVISPPVGAASSVTFGGGVGGATCRVNWVAYGI